MAKPTNSVEPTNSEILAELKSMNKVIERHGTDIDGLKDWRRGTEIAKAAVDEYKRELELEGKGIKTVDAGINQDSFKLMGKALGIISALIALFYAFLQSFPK
jgi:hypothetical protein